MAKSFVDLLFILLCSTIVMLSQSLRIGAVETAPAKLGSGGLSAVSTDDVSVVVVDANLIELVQQGTQVKCDTLEDLCDQLADDSCVLLVAARENVSHHVVMGYWDDLRKKGFEVKLGAVEKHEK